MKEVQMLKSVINLKKNIKEKMVVILKIDGLIIFQVF